MIAQIFQLHVSLQYAKPPIWRRLLVSSGISLDDLHRIIQTAMGWTNSHLHQFVHESLSYDSENFERPEAFATELVPLDSILQKPKQKFHYEYDFGDGWLHVILLEKILPADVAVTLPSCVDGKGNCPPENCGGIGGYHDLLAILANPKHKEHREMLEWLGGEFDPAEFDLNLVNEALQSEDFGCISLAW